jgi:hypothetical protein
VESFAPSEGECRTITIPDRRSIPMLSFARIRDLLSQTRSSRPSPRRRSRANLRLEPLEGRALMSSVVTPFPAPHAPANGALILCAPLCKKLPSAQLVGPGHNGTQIVIQGG